MLKMIVKTNHRIKVLQDKKINRIKNHLRLIIKKKILNLKLYLVIRLNFKGQWNGSILNKDSGL